MTHTIAAMAFIGGWVACAAWRALDVHTIRSPLAAWRFAHPHERLGWGDTSWKGVRVRFCAYMLGRIGTRDYGQRFYPKGYVWRDWFVRITPWPHEGDECANPYLYEGRLK